MTTLVKVLKMVEIENIGQGNNFSQKMKNMSTFLGRKDTLRHARLSRNSSHTGTFKPRRHSSEFLSRNKLLKRKMVEAEKESISRISEKLRKFFLSDRKRE